jgi:uncharacterized protein (TIGR02246 family)
MNTEKNAIEQVLKNFEETWNGHDVNDFSLLFATDADFTNVFGMQSHGREAIKQFHAPLFATMFKSSILTIAEIKIRFIKSDVAAVDANWKMSGATDPNGNPWLDRNGLINLIMTPGNDGWVITVMHNMDIPKLPS